jgi:hypothetical protein
MFQYQALGGNPNLMRDGQDKIVTKKNYPQYFKLVLCSKDRDVGSTKSYAKFSDVKLPESFSAPAVFMVESFNITLALDGYGNPVFDNLEVHMPELLQTRSWSSRTKNVTDVICVTDANASFYNGSCNVNSLGVPILAIKNFSAPGDITTKKFSWGGEPPSPAHHMHTSAPQYKLSHDVSACNGWDW